MKMAIPYMLAILLVTMGIGANAENTLSIMAKKAAGELSNPLFDERYPEVNLRKEDNALTGSAMDMAERMISRDDQFDLFGIGYDYGGFEYMMEKNYCYDLSSDHRIKEQINRMHPFLQQAVKMEDHIYGVPISVDGTGWGYSITNLQAVGIDPPDSYESLLDLMIWWIDEGKDEYPDYVFIREIGGLDVRTFLIRRIVFDYIDVCQEAGKEVRFETSNIIGLFAKLDSIDTTIIDKEIRENSDGMSYEDNALFIPQKSFTDLTSISIYGDEKAMPLSIARGGDSVSAVDIRVFVLNPESKNVEGALNYLACYLEGMNSEMQIRLFMGDHDPIPYEGYERDRAELEETLRRLEDEIQYAEDDKKNELEYSIMVTQRDLDEVEKMKWMINSDSIDNYTRLTRQMFVKRQSLLKSDINEGELQIQQLIDYYAAGQVNAQQFVQQVDDKLEMITSESVF